jgi:hypothetical protein
MSKDKNYNKLRDKYFCFHPSTKVFSFKTKKFAYMDTDKIKLPNKTKPRPLSKGQVKSKKRR